MGILKTNISCNSIIYFLYTVNFTMYCSEILPCIALLWLLQKFPEVFRADWTPHLTLSIQPAQVKVGWKEIYCLKKKKKGVYKILTSCVMTGVGYDCSRIRQVQKRPQNVILLSSGGEHKESSKTLVRKMSQRYCLY